MKKLINILLIALALAFVVPVNVKAEATDNIKCMCKNGEQCPHRLPSRIFSDFEEWENYYFSHREVGIYWDSYLYKTFAFKYDANKNIIWKPNLCYPFDDVETWKFWFKTCIEKQKTGEYRYEF